MENVEKLRIVLQHWIDHNKGHAEEFEKWQKNMADDGQNDLAACIAKAISAMNGVNDQLSMALEKSGGNAAADGTHHHHHHGDHHHHHHDHHHDEHDEHDHHHHHHDDHHHH